MERRFISGLGGEDPITLSTGKPSKIEMGTIWVQLGRKGVRREGKDWKGSDLGWKGKKERNSKILVIYRAQNFFLSG